ncbi:MAG: sigma-70 family RNA polymerase sigma factor [Proteobacteria bacterium]|nr:sigma-70 family RNA polymerase sigma factor [Pseudomonadota bacterium]
MENMEPPPAADYVVDSVYGSRAVNLPLQKMFLVQITNKRWPRPLLPDGNELFQLVTRGTLFAWQEGEEDRPIMPVLAIRPDLHPSDWSDRKLLRLVLRGEERAWTELLRRYRSLMYRCITKTTAKYSAELSDADVDEVFAEVLIQLWRNDMSKLRQFNPDRGTKLGSWLGLIACNAAYDFLRSSSRGLMLDRITGTVDPHTECNQTPLDVLIEKERWAHFNKLLSKFSHKDRMFLELYYARGFDATRVADKMSISLKTVYSKKHKIRTHLRRTLERSRSECAIRDLLQVAA